MSLAQTDIIIPTPDGQMPAVLVALTHSNPQPAVLLLIEALGVTSHIRDMAARMAAEDYTVLVPDLDYRELPNNKFGYDEQLVAGFPSRVNLSANL